jgi:hypothetical protein
MRIRGEVAILALAVVAALVVAAVALAEPIADLSARVSPSKPGTNHKPRRVEVDLALSQQTDTAGEALPATTKLQFFLPSEFFFGGADFHSCKADILDDQNQQTQCPVKSKVGSGRAVFQVGGPGGSVAQSTLVTAYNGPRGKSLLLHLQSQTPVAIDQALEGRLSKSSKPYGQVLTFAFPPELQARAGLSELEFELEGTRTVRRNGHRRTIPYVGLGSCGDDVLDFKSVTTFAHIAELGIAADDVSCRR